MSQFPLFCYPHLHKLTIVFCTHQYKISKIIPVWIIFGLTERDILRKDPVMTFWSKSMRDWIVHSKINSMHIVNRFSFHAEFNTIIGLSLLARILMQHIFSFCSQSPCILKSSHVQLSSQHVSCLRYGEALFWLLLYQSLQFIWLLPDPVAGLLRAGQVAL